MHTLKDAFEQRRLGPKVMVEGSSGHPRFQGEILDRSGGKTSLTEQPQPGKMSADRVCATCSARSDGRTSSPRSRSGISLV